MPDSTSTGESFIEVDNGETDRNSNIQNNDALSTSSDVIVGMVVGKSIYAVYAAQINLKYCI